MNSWKFSKDRMPHFSETCTISPISIAKPAALLFDKILVGTREKKVSKDYFIEVPEELTFGNAKIEGEAFEMLKNTKATHKMVRNIKGLPMTETEMLVHIVLRCFVEAYAKNGILVTPIYESEQSFKYEYPDGNSLACQAALNNIAIVDNDGVSWNQVLEFRKDSEAVKKYRALRIWLREGIEAESVAHATDIIGKKIDDYEWAI